MSRDEGGSESACTMSLLTRKTVIEKMSERNGHNGRGRVPTAEALEQVAYDQYLKSLQTDSADAHWLFGQRLRDLRRRKRVTAGKFMDYMENLGYDPIRMEHAMTIRDNHDNLDSVAGMTVKEAWEHHPEPTRNRTRRTRPPKVVTTPVPSTNGDGKHSPDPKPTTANAKELRLLSGLEPTPVEWLWDGYVPLGELTIAEGHPGTNKSLLVYDLAARLTTGQAMPCMKAEGSGADGTLFLIGEDSITKTVVARLKAAGADLDRVAVLDDVAIPDDRHAIEKAIRKIRAKLVVIDTLNDFLNCNVLGNQQVRRALRPLRELAEKTNVAVVLLRHFIKASGGSSLLRGGGSVGITAMARSQLKLFRHPDDPNLRVLVQDKCNLGPLSPSLLFEVVPIENSIGIKWHGPCALTAEELERKQKGSPTLDAAEQFLMDKLADCPKEANWLVEQARGICSKRTLDEAKRNLGLITHREGKGQEHRVYWSLPTPGKAPAQEKPNN